MTLIIGEEKEGLEEKDEASMFQIINLNNFSVIAHNFFVRTTNKEFSK